VTAVLDRVVEAYWRHQFLEEVNASFAALRADAEAWRARLAARAAWDGALMDGIEADQATPE
jgi:hypothetical protein